MLLLCSFFLHSVAANFTVEFMGTKAAVISAYDPLEADLDKWERGQDDMIDEQSNSFYPNDPTIVQCWHSWRLTASLVKSWVGRRLELFCGSYNLMSPIFQKSPDKISTTAQLPPLALGTSSDVLLKAVASSKVRFNWYDSAQIVKMIRLSLLRLCWSDWSVN